jgi:hypothetical protein
MTKTIEKTFTKKDLEKEWDDGVEYGREQGRLDVFGDLLKIKYVTWSVHSVYGRAKNNTIGEVWKGIDRLYIKHGLQGTDHKFIESIDIEGNVLKFYTGS